MIKTSNIKLYINKAKSYGQFGLNTLIRFVKNPDNKIILVLLAVAIVLFLIRQKETFQNVDFMYLKDKEDYLCCDLSFKKDKPAQDSVQLMKHNDNTVSLKFTNNNHYIGINKNNLLVSNPLDEDCSYEFVLNDNILRSVKNGMYVARSGNDVVLSSFKDRALHLNAE